MPTPAVVLGGGLAAAGFLALLDRLRRRWLRRRESGTQPPTPSRQARQVEARLRAGADPEAGRFLAAALNHLQAGLAGRPGADIPAVKGAVLDDGGLAVLVEPADPQPPDGWSAKDGGAVWKLGRPDDPAELGTDHTPAAALLPALVGVGHNGQGSRVLLNLEYLGVVSLLGTHEEVAGAMHTMAIELACSPAAAGLEIICVGFGEKWPLERIHAVGDVDEVAGVLADDARHGAETLQGRPAGPLAGRVAADVADTWTPTVVFDPTGDARTIDAATTSAQAGPVAVVAGDADGAVAWELHLDGDQVRLPAMGELVLAWPTLTGGQRDAIAELLELAADGQPEPAAPNLLAIPAADGEKDSAPARRQANTKTAEGSGGEPVVATGPAVVSDNGHRGREAADRPADDGDDDVAAVEPAVDVRVLGPVHIDGRASGFDYQEKAQELICYLALNRHASGIAADTLMERLWPATDEAASTKKQRLQRVASDARRALGSTDDGRRLLPKAGNNGRYRLLDQVGCDLTRFHDHHQAADGAPPEKAIRHLEAALELVEGEPFSNVSGYSWATAESQDAQLAADQAARELASLYLDRGDLAGVRWATRQGLKALPGVQELYRLRMRAAAAAGNLRELDGVHEELRAVLADDAYAPGGSLEIQAETVELYETLRRQTAGQGAGPDETGTEQPVGSLVDEAAN